MHLTISYALLSYIGSHSVWRTGCNGHWLYFRQKNGHLQRLRCHWNPPSIRMSYLKVSHTFMQFTHNFYAICDIFANLWPFSTCWVSKSMYLSYGIQWQYFHTLMHFFTHIQTIFMQFGLFWPILGHFQHGGYKNHVLKLGSSMVLLSHTLTHSFTQFNEHLHSIQAIWAVQTDFG